MPYQAPAGEHADREEGQVDRSVAPSSDKESDAPSDGADDEKNSEVDQGDDGGEKNEGDVDDGYVSVHDTRPMYTLPCV